MTLIKVYEDRYAQGMYYARYRVTADGGCCGAASREDEQIFRTREDLDGFPFADEAWKQVTSGKVKPE